MGKLTPTQRTLRAIRQDGREAAIVEKWNPHAGVRQDLFGVIDILALDPVKGFVGVQCTGNDFAGHFKKLTEEKAQECLNWLRTPGGNLELWAWRKVKVKRGGKQKVWEPRIYEFKESDFETVKEDEDIGDLFS